MQKTPGTFRLFQLAGIHVFLHWSWFVLAIIEIQLKGRYTSIAWNILEYLALFAIVTMHEFGHALACRQVGGRADRIVLWPLGGAAYVDPPARPGATLWSIAAGPLVNVVLVPVLVVALFIERSVFGSSNPDLSNFMAALNVINLGLLVFNVLPIYPLDGGKILHALLWYFMGRGRSLMASVIVGFVGIAGLGVVAFVTGNPWFAVITLFAGLQCFNGFKVAQALRRIETVPRREGVSCPVCNANPPRGVFWSCGLCKSTFDTFEVHGQCPKCFTTFPKTTCADCGAQSAFSDWVATSPT